MTAEQVWVDMVTDLGDLAAPPTQQLQAVVDLTARICRVPLAQINFFTRDEQRQVAAHGMDPSACALEDSMCHVVRHDLETVVVPDTRLDPRFADNPFVTGRLGLLRFYASHPLTTASGLVVGRLCVFDTRPRTLEEIAGSEVDSLGVVAARVMDVLELALRNRELVHALEHVEAMRTELLTSHDRLAAFAGQVSHDLKTPLSSVSLSLGLIREQLAGGGGSAEELDWLVTKAGDAAGRMSALVDDVLAFAQVGGSELHQDVDLAEVLGEVLDDVGSRLDGGEVLVGPLPVVCGDRTQLRSLLQNLVTNALAYRSPDRRLQVEVDGGLVDHRWLLEVRDNGRGIAPEDVERVFVPLQRGAHDVAGSGIGLATCRRIVEAHGGRISLRPRAGHGAVALVELPTG
ncbi:Phytochrome-like protein cph1 [Nocardioides aquaticus]|uniref:Sensor-like histidine kinase SenX3 n=1 Tax=Nocardioides aquaticus TaxID=160826 RepID=A0ABX8EF35_9ACTN|nr:GAF domain-containing sensor histidine kinase [Nocardioides aquaticus]QVT79110.1 Phytochrome-like protein cph1 [Nocardioides aquaticus]